MCPQSSRRPSSKTQIRPRHASPLKILPHLPGSGASSVGTLLVTPGHARSHGHACCFALCKMCAASAGWRGLGSELVTNLSEIVLSSRWARNVHLASLHTPTTSHHHRRRLEAIDVTRGSACLPAFGPPGCGGRGRVDGTRTVSTGACPPHPSTEPAGPSLVAVRTVVPPPHPTAPHRRREPGFVPSSCPSPALRRLAPAHPVGHSQDFGFFRKHYLPFSRLKMLMKV